MRNRSAISTLLFAGTLIAGHSVQAQTWSALKNQPALSVGLCMLLTDGGVICQSGGSWTKLSPDATGSYVNGTWSRIASLPSGYVPDAFASAVLADGRVVIIGGEYNNGSFVLSNQGAIYDPLANTWTSVAPPTGFTYIGDAPATVLADGTFLIGSKLDQRMAVLNPATLTWTIVSQTGKADGFNSEEGWTLLPDGSVFTLDVKNAPDSERFIPSTSHWVTAGNTPVDLHTPTTSGGITVAPGVVYHPPGEMGPALLRPDGTVFAVGATGQTAIFTPPPPNSVAPGTWVLGPKMPSGLNVEDGPAALLPSGHVLVAGSPGDSGKGVQIFEFDGTNLIAVPASPRANSDATYYTSMLVLPSGQVMFVDGSNTVEIYTPSSAPTYDPSWRPAITSFPAVVSSGSTYQIIGTQFNGLSQGTAFGDESQNATNYPLVRIANNATGHVFYARTHGHSSMGVATGSTLVSTYFDVPATIEAGIGTLVVVANGIPSAPSSVTVISTVGVPATIAAASGNGQNAAVNTSFASPLVATVRDSAGNAVSSATVLFTAQGSGPGGNFSGSTSAAAVTNTAGNATSPLFSANGTPGTYNVTATTPGVAAPANFTLTNTPPTALTISPGSVNFGAVDQGQQSSPVSVTARNTGGTAITFSGNVQLKGTQANQFKIVSSNCQNTLAAGASCAVTVQFQPNAIGTAAAILAFSDNAPNSPQAITLTGNGVNPKISLHPGNLNFQKEAMGSSAQQTVTLSSSGSTPLVIASISGAAPFAASSNCPMSPASLAPGTTCSITVTFAPITAGNSQGSIFITDNASGSPQRIDVQGQTVHP